MFWEESRSPGRGLIGQVIMVVICRRLVRRSDEWVASQLTLHIADLHISRAGCGGSARFFSVFACGMIPDGSLCT